MIVYCFPNEITEYFCRQLQKRMLPVLSTLLLNRQLVLSLLSFPFLFTLLPIIFIQFTSHFPSILTNWTQLNLLTWLDYCFKSVELFTRDHQRDSQKKDACPLIPLNKLYYYFTRITFRGKLELLYIMPILLFKLTTGCFSFKLSFKTKKQFSVLFCLLPFLYRSKKSISICFL